MVTSKLRARVSAVEMEGFVIKKCKHLLHY